MGPCLASISVVGADDAEILPAAPDHLLALALSRPHDALTAARAVLAGRPPAYQASIAHQAAGIVLRDRGDLDAAIGELRRALRLARASGRPERETDVQATLGAALAWAGRSQQGLAELDHAAASARGALAGRVLMRRASVLKDLGRYGEALHDLCRAVPLLRRAGDRVWEARSLTHRAEVYLAFGSTSRAGADFSVAEGLFAASGQELEYAKARHNRGLAAIARGDLPTALAYLDEAGRRYDALDATVPDLAIDRCAALLAAGLTQDAMREADSAAAHMRQEGGHVYKRAELLLAAATAALASGEPLAARDRAQRARRLFGAQRRDLWAARAEFVVVHARHAAGEHTDLLLEQAERISSRLDELRAEEAPRAHLLAGRMALERGRAAEAEQHLKRAARTRRRGPPVARSVAWLARALQAEAHGEVRATLAACARGLDALDEHRMTLGATELRAHATAHGAELATIAQRDAIRRGDARRLLLWGERWRATALSLPPARPVDNQELVAELSALRDVTRRLEATRAKGAGTAVLERDRRRLENAVRARTLQTLGNADRHVHRFDLNRLFAGLGETRLVELVEVDGLLHVITVANRRVRRHPTASITVANREVNMACFLLRRLSYGRGGSRAGSLLDQAGNLLEEVLLGPAAADLGDGPVVVVPPGRLHAVPWALLPSLRERVVSVAPSASTWLLMSQRQPPERPGVTLVVGPGLGTGGAEVPLLAERYPGATVLGHGTATAERVLAALDGAWLAHIAAHGAFRSDNPLFSALRLDDGPLTVHDFERLQQAPYRLVLSSCDSGVAAPVGADELLGLVSSLVPLGAVGILASVVPVNDVAAVPLMLALHDALRRNATLPEALLAARTQVGDDAIGLSTAQSFIALGA